MKCNFFEKFDDKKGFRQSDGTVIARNSQSNTRSTIFPKSVQLFTYAYAIDILGRAQRAVNGVVETIEADVAKMGYPVNEGKLKYVPSTTIGAHNQRIIQNTIMDNVNSEVARDFFYPRVGFTR